MGSGHRGRGSKQIQNLGGKKSDECSKAFDRFSAKRDVPKYEEKAEDRHPEEYVNLHQFPGYFLQAELAGRILFFRSWRETLDRALGFGERRLTQKLLSSFLSSAIHANIFTDLFESFARLCL
jgi:hypothetical protein